MASIPCTAELPLAGLLVVSLEQALAAPLATSRLAQMGARVIKIERAEGDFARQYDSVVHGQSSYFLWVNQGKESLVLDIKQAADADLLHQLLARADVLVQNLAPGALARAGFESAALRGLYPQLISCDISGYGEDNAASELKAYDMLVQCESALVGVSGAPDAPGRIGVSICDIGAGLNATIAILSALALRAQTGKGSGVAVSLFDSTTDWMTVPYLHQQYGAKAPAPQGLAHPSIAPYEAFTTRDGKCIVISIQNEREWTNFCAHFLRDPDLATDQRFCSNSMRVSHREVLHIKIVAVFGELGSDEALRRLQLANTAYGQVRSVADLAVHPALRTQSLRANDQDYRSIAPPVRAPWNNLTLAPAPHIGQHSAALRAEFGQQTKAGFL
jgi:itaconate CoA-transferase